MTISVRIISLFVAIMLASFGALAADQEPVASKSVKVSTLAELAIYPERSAPATVVSLNESVISAEITATVTAVEARVGDVMRPGETLATLNCADYQLAVRSSQAALDSVNARIELARLNYERVQRLLDQKSVSQEDLDSRNADLVALRADKRGAQASLELARINQQRCNVTSPMHALVTERIGSVGQLAVPGTVLFTLLDLDNIEVSAQVYAADAESLESSSELFMDQDGERYPLTLRSVLPAIDSTTRNREARLQFVERATLAGAAGKIVWRDDRPHVPPELLVERDGRLGVFVYEGGQARFVELPGAQPGRSNPVQLEPSVELVVEGHYGLKHDDSLGVN